MSLADSADYCIKRERWKDAEDYIKRALRLQPAYKGNSMLLSNLGVVQTHLGKFSEALQSYSAGLGIGRDSVALLNNRAYTRLSMAEEALALEDLECSLGIDSIQEWPLKMCGLIFMKDGKVGKARDMFERLLVHYPSNSAGASGMGAVLAAENNYEEALKWYDKALSINASEEDWFYKILTECRLEKDYEAYDDIRTALKAFPRSGNLYALQAYILRRRYQFVEAEQALRLAYDNGAEPQVISDLMLDDKHRKK